MDCVGDVGIEILDIFIYECSMQYLPYGPTSMIRFKENF